MFLMAMVLLLACFGCDNKTVKSTDNKVDISKDIFSFDMEEVFVKVDGCDSGLQYCSHVMINYPVFRSDKMKDANKLILSRIAELMGDNDTVEAIDLTKSANDFIKSYESFKKDFPDSPQIWVFRLKSRISFADDEKVSILIAYDSNTGGAHGNLGQLFLNFNSRGRILDNSELIEDSTKLKQVAEHKFRLRKGIEENKSLNESGFSFPGDKFVLPNNIGLADKAFILYYSPYEIGSYAIGPTQIIVGFDELK
jgi:mannitol/fructose-specific phosphotransferase system IIA component (Ntr-type)